MNKLNYLDEYNSKYSSNNKIIGDKNVKDLLITIPMILFGLFLINYIKI